MEGNIPLNRGGLYCTENGTMHSSIVMLTSFKIQNVFLFLLNVRVVWYHSAFPGKYIFLI